ncbi:MAG: DUF6880 family protein [Roseobacter sp.]|uniref:DUF6880 family protein n=1 Tax=Rhodobacterales TaxID=204455 RepID=UPI00328F66D7
MSKKTLNKSNLADLGADRLADLLIEVSQGSADIKRRLRLELSHNLGMAELAHEVRKRLASLRKSKSFISWRKRKGLVKDLETQIAMIVEKIALEDPNTAFDLLWQFIEVAPFLYERVDDRRGDVGDVFRAAILHFADIAPRTEADPEALADRVWTAMSDNGYGEWDGIISLMAPTLGDAGLSYLKDHVERFSDAPVADPENEHDAIIFLRELRGETDYRADQKQRFVRQCLQDIATASGDANAYIAQYTADDLRNKAIAAEVAGLLLEDGKANDALVVLGNVDDDGRSLGQDQWDEAYIATLLALGRDDDAQAHRWACFAARLSVEHLQAFLKELPDFEDVEAEDKARAYVLEYPNVMPALHFCLQWPDLPTAAQLVRARASELDGDHYELLVPAADMLRDRHPLAATVVWRAMIAFALDESRVSRYGHVASHLKECGAVAEDIEAFDSFPNHDRYVDELRMRHERKSSFWAQFDTH